MEVLVFLQLVANQERTNLVCLRFDWSSTPIRQQVGRRLLGCEPPNRLLPGREVHFVAVSIAQCLDAPPLCPTVNTTGCRRLRRRCKAVYCCPFREDKTQDSTNQGQQNTQAGRPRPHCSPLRRCDLGHRVRRRRCTGRVAGTSSSEPGVVYQALPASPRRGRIPTAL